MDNIYFLVVIILFFLAISDLIVGVSNDAVNFLNSAIGSKVASFKLVMFIAALGVFIGTTFSGGMMEIARSGIFNPEKFSFSDIMLIFVAVMITDIILLDLFNTFGLPTSTTVSLIFELLGASVGIAWMKINQSGDPQAISEFINSSKALTIISGILVSVVIAFTVGALIQYLTRLIFSFDYLKRFKYFGGIFGGFAITAIVYFILIKGAKDAIFMTDTAYGWIVKHEVLILFSSLAVFTLLFQLLHTLFRVNILKLVVLAGTFALAMAFAGNDLVNFIGVPLAGFESFKTLINNPGSNPDLFMMGSLRDSISTPTGFLILAGIIMVITLYTSKKAKTVIDTEVNLGRQDVGYERFGSSQFSRAVVRLIISVSDNFTRFIPEKLKERMAKQFKPVPVNKNEKNPPAFDQLRAAVNLVVSSALIAMGTSLKLPLSTTYVTFMVAMGTSLSDGAWDRESAVYRVTGVFSVIGGWFFTALSAFLVSALLAVFFFYGGFYAIGIMVALSIYMVIRTHKLHSTQVSEKAKITSEHEEISSDNILVICNQNITEILTKTRAEFSRIVDDLSVLNVKGLKKSKKSIEKLVNKIKDRKINATYVITQLKDNTLESGHFYMKTLDHLSEILLSLNFIALPVYDHANNNHKHLSPAQIDELKYLSQSFDNFILSLSNELESDVINQIRFNDDQQKILTIIDKLRRNEIRRIKNEPGSTRNSLLFMNILQESKNLILFGSGLYKSKQEFLNNDPLKL